MLSCTTAIFAYLMLSYTLYFYSLQPHFLKLYSSYFYVLSQLPIINLFEMIDTGPIQGPISVNAARTVLWS